MTRSSFAGVRSQTPSRNEHVSTDGQANNIISDHLGRNAGYLGSFLPQPTKQSAEPEIGIRTEEEPLLNSQGRASAIFVLEKARPMEWQRALIAASSDTDTDDERKKRLEKDIDFGMQ